jgi:hypothetical protein
MSFLWFCLIILISFEYKILVVSQESELLDHQELINRATNRSESTRKSKTILELILQIIIILQIILLN